MVSNIVKLAGVFFENEGCMKTTVFISYAWTSDEHRAWVRLLASHLRLIGYTVLIDSSVEYGSSLNGFMREVAGAGRVLMIIDENYVDRADNRPGSGVDYENHWIRGVIHQKPETWRSVLFVDNEGYKVPVWLADKRPKSFDFNSRPKLGQFPGSEQLDDLWRWIEGLPADKAHALSPDVLFERLARIERIGVMRDPANYASAGLQGRVTFQHDAHTAYSVGHGEYKFSIMFSNLNVDSVAVYIDAGLKAVGLLPDAGFDPRTVASFLSSDRTAMPAVGQKVVLMNEVGSLCVITIEVVQQAISSPTFIPAAVTFAYKVLVEC